jgi:SAM-dependent methyltransferase
VSRGEEFFLKIHSDLPREGPGDPESTKRAYASIGGVTASGRILDVGCGPGAQTLDLATITAASIVALDNHRPYLDRLRRRLRAEGMSERVRTVRASMFAMPFADGAFDVVWAEGAIYILGLERALTEWRALLRPGGHIAATHLSWLVDDVPAEPHAFWQRHFPAMRHVEHNAALCRRCGYDVVEQFALPESAWWRDYYGPLERRLAALGLEHRGDEAALAMIDETREQIELYRAFADAYGYVFFVLRVR